MVWSKERPMFTASLASLSYRYVSRNCSHKQRMRLSDSHKATSPQVSRLYECHMTVCLFLHVTYLCVYFTFHTLFHCPIFLLPSSKYSSSLPIYVLLNLWNSLMKQLNSLIFLKARQV